VRDPAGGLRARDDGARRGPCGVQRERWVALREERPRVAHNRGENAGREATFEAGLVGGQGPQRRLGRGAPSERGPELQEAVEVCAALFEEALGALLDEGREPRAVAR